MPDVFESESPNRTPETCVFSLPQYTRSNVSHVENCHKQEYLPVQSKRICFTGLSCEDSIPTSDHSLIPSLKLGSATDLSTLRNDNTMNKPTSDYEHSTLPKPVLSQDFTEILPFEVSLRILSYLALCDILVCAKVSHRWNRIASDPLLWFRLCERSDLVHDAIRSTGTECLPQSRETFSLSSPFDTISSGSPATQKNQHGYSQALSTSILNINWKSIYRRNVESQCNWRHGVHLKPIVLSAHHNHVITCLEVYKDWAITGSDDSSICIWSITRETLLISLFGHIGGVWSLTVLAPITGEHRQPPLLVSGSCDRTARVWLLDGVRWPCIATLFGHQSTVRCLAGQQVNRSRCSQLRKTPNDLRMSFGNNKTDVNNEGTDLPSTMHTDGSTVLDEEPDGLRLVATGSRDTTVRLWNATSGRCLRLFEGHRGAIRCVQFNESKVVSGSYDCTVRVWSILTETCLNVLVGHENRVYTLVFDGENVISASLDTTIRVWNASTGELQQTFRGHQSLTSGLAYDSDQQILISSNADETLRIWDLQSGRCLHILAGAHKHHSAVTSVQLTKYFIVSSSDDGTVKLWDRRSGAYIRDLIRLDGAGRGGVVWRIVASEDKLVCAAGSRTGMEATKLIILRFDGTNAQQTDARHICSERSNPAPPPRLSEILAVRTI